MNHFRLPFDLNLPQGRGSKTNNKTKDICHEGQCSKNVFFLIVVFRKHFFVS